MEPLATNRRCLIWLRMCPADEPSSQWQKRIFRMVVYASLLFCITGNVAYCVEYISIDLGRSLFAIVFLAEQISIAYIIIVATICLRFKIDSMLKNLSAIYKNAEENVHSFRFLAQANNFSEWMWNYFLKYVTIFVALNTVLTPIISILYCWLIDGNLNVAKFYHPSPIILPWNQTTPMAYAGEISIVTTFALSCLFIDGTFLLLFISICVHHQKFHKMLKHSIDHKMNHSAECDDDGDERNRRNKKLLCHLIQFHISVKDWFSDTAEIYSSLIMIKLICSEILMSISFFYLDLQFRHSVLDAIIAISAFFVGTSVIFVYCYYGKLATDSYQKMSHCVFQMDWYELPNELQKNVIIVIANMQKDCKYHAFGVINLDLETFTKLFKSAISYYLAIKTVTSTRAADS